MCGSRQEPPNFLRAAALGEYKKPVVVMPGEQQPEEEEVEQQPEIGEVPQVRSHTSRHARQQYLTQYQGVTLLFTIFAVLYAEPNGST